jgi:putative ABC transport system permease protein
MKLFRRLRYWLHARQNHADLAEEMEFHRAMLDGGTELGNATLAREDARAVWIWPWLESVVQDIRYTLRNLRAQPGFATIAILALGCAIGLNTSLFTVFNAVALRPWPVHDASRVVNILSLTNRHDTRGFSLAEFRYLAGHSKTFSGMLVHRTTRVNAEDGPANSSWVSGSYFSVLGVGMQQGRGFLPEEDLAEAPSPVAVVSDWFWRARLGSDPHAAGRKIRIEDVPFTIVGVADGDFTGTSPDRVDIYVPNAAGSILQPMQPWIKDFLTSPTYCCSNLAGRLAQGVSRKQGEAELAVLHQQFLAQSHEQAYGVQLAGTAFFGNAKKEKIVPIFTLMFLGVTLVLLLACANVGNLLLARAAARRREISVRLSLGASRKRVIRQLLTESLVLACAAGALGSVAAWWLPTWVFQYAVGDTISFRFTPDATVLFYALALSIATCMIFGLAPALHGTKPADNESRHRLRSILLSAQVALSVILLVSAGLLARGIQRARKQDPGFQIAGVSIATFALPSSAYDGPRAQAFFTQLTRDLEGAHLGVTLGLSRLAPLGNGANWTGFRYSGQLDKTARQVVAHQVTSGYFEVLGIPVLAGRNFEPIDDSRPVAIVNESFARRYFDNDALGKTIITNVPRQIVGVVKDAYTRGLDEIDPTLYFPISGAAVPLALFHADPETSEAIAAIVKQLDPRARVTITPLSENLDKWMQSSRAGASIAEIFGAFALALATIGMFGVFAYWVEQRTREIGIRMALGARPQQVIGLVLGSSSRSVLAGLLLGFGGAAAMSRLLQRFLFGLSPFDPVSYAMVAVMLAAAGLAATFLPARRATNIDPITALRCE